MSVHPIKRALAAALILTGVGAAAAVSATHAKSDAFAFELVEREIKQGHGATLKVRLVDVRTGKTVPDAVLFISRLDMSPDGMGEMSAPLEPMPDTLPGYYLFETDLSMAGSWALTLAAKVPGVSGAVQGRLVLQAVP